MKTDHELTTAGFTNSGKKRYQATLTEYSDALFTRATALGDADKAPNTPREVTHEHVRDAAEAISRRRGEGRTPAQIWCQAGEYVCAALAGMGAAKLEHTWGIVLFVLSVAIGVILFIVRSNPQRT